MRRLSRKKRIVSAVLAAGAICFAAVAYAGDGLVRTDDSSYIGEFRKKYATSDDSGWETVSSGEIVCDNGRIRLTMDAATTHFTVTDLSTGNSFSSVPLVETGVGTQIHEEVQSELVLEYYDSQSNQNILCSDRDSVKNGSFLIKRHGDTLRVYYTFGNLAENIEIPQVLLKEVFEEEILPALDSSQARRIQRYYRLVSPDEQDDTYERFLQIYKQLKDTPLYILRDDPTELQQSEIREAMEKAGYTADRYKQDCKKLGIEVQESEKPTAFRIGVEYSLTDTGFEAGLLTDTLVENNSNDKVTSIRLLEGFVGCENGKDGYILLPDGSGCIIPFGVKGGLSRTLMLYGEDKAAVPESVSYERVAALPVFGMRQGETGFFAEIRQGAEVCSLTVRTQGGENPVNQVFPSFRIREFQVTDIGGPMAIPLLNIYAANTLSVSPRVRYHFLAGEDATYTGMARFYRSLLMEEGVLSKLEGDTAPLFLDFNCLVTYEDDFFGIPFDKKIPLSTLKAILTVCEELKKQGVDNISVRLRGIGNGGLNNRVNRNFNLDRKVGSLAELKHLANWLNTNGGKLSIDADFTYVYSDGILDGYSQTADTAKHIDKSLVVDNGYNLVTLTYSDKEGYRYLLSPFTYIINVNSYLRSFSKALNGAPVSFGWGTAGSSLGGDYDRKRLYDRCMAADKIAGAAQSAAEITGAMVTDIGNRYLLGFVDEIRNMALTDSSMNIPCIPVPFYPMVVHGCVAYSGRPLNFTSNPKKELLASVESGAGLYFSWITAGDESLLKAGIDDKYYSLNWRDSVDKAVEQYKRLKDFYSAVSGQEITGHRRLTGEVSETTFSNGARAIVNYGKSAYKDGGILVEAEDFLLIYP